MYVVSKTAMWCSSSSSCGSGAGPRDWAALQSDALLCIAGKLTTIDYIAFRAVCRSWSSAVPAIPLQAPHAPYLLLGPDGGGGGDVFTFLSLPDNTFHRFRIPKLVGKYCVGSQYGWLATVDTRRRNLALLNPFTGQEIPLPPITALSDRLPDGIFPCRSDVIKIVMSSDPADGTAYTVAAILCPTTEPKLIFTGAGDSEWYSHPNRENHDFYDLAFDPRGRLIGLATTRGGGTWLRMLRLVEIDVGSGESRTLLRISGRLAAHDMHLAAHDVGDSCGGSSLLYVSRDRISRGDRTKQIEIFESAMAPAEGRCTMISLTSLGGRALFVGSGSSVLLSTSDVRSLKLKENHVYFTDSWWSLLVRWVDSGVDAGIYNLEDQTISFLIKRDEKINKIKPRNDEPYIFKWLSPIWVTPSLHRRPTG